MEELYTKLTPERWADRLRKHFEAAPNFNLFMNFNNCFHPMAVSEGQAPQHQEKIITTYKTWFGLNNK
eukprot:gene13289-21058_t